MSPSRARSSLIGPDTVVGILGGGQLGRMMALAGAKLGLTCHIYAPEKDAPAFDVVKRATIAAYEDEAALAQFARAVDVVTYEFENVPAATAAALAKRIPVRPGPNALAVTQDRVVEKSFVRDLGLNVPAFAAVDDDLTLAAAVREVGLPAVLKTRRFGYDGKGQAVIKAGGDPEGAFAAIGRQPAILEAFVPFEREVSVLVVRSITGDIRLYDPIENVHRDGILRRSTVPAAINASTRAMVERVGRTLADALDYVGVLAVEMFVTPDGTILVNEMAPRVHNSGHWTEAACICSQFENHMRAVAGLPLGSTHRHSNAVMENLIGADVEGWETLAAEAGASLTLYGKRDMRAGRKMGHVTWVTARV
ncbi:MAG: 5-(carboxyamino)imidazole ribonucleotide synthase [Alphaproteobacteria bacterium]